MLGLPGETSEDIQATIELNRQVNPDGVRISYYHRYPGTPLGDSDNSENAYEPYWSIPANMKTSVKELCYSWITQLRQQGKLWYTVSEERFLLDDIEGHSL